MEGNNITFKSNIMPVKTSQITDDYIFLSSITDVKALEKLVKVYPLSKRQQRIYNDTSFPCSLSIEDGDYPFGFEIDETGKEHFVCKCINNKCSSFDDCRNGKECTIEEFKDLEDNINHVQILNYVDSSILELMTYNANMKEDYIKVTFDDDGGLYIVKDTAEDKPTDKFQNISSIIRSNAPTEAGIFTVNDDTFDELPKKKIIENWKINPKVPPQRLNLNLCTKTTYRRINSIISNYVFPSSSNIFLDEIKSAMGSGKHTSTGYDGIIRAHLLNKELSKIPSERANEILRLKEKLGKLSPAKPPTDILHVSFGTKVTLEDLVTGNLYSCIILGPYDFEYIEEDHRILSYDSDIGACLYGLTIGDKIEMKFRKDQESFHTSKIIDIEISDLIN